MAPLWQPDAARIAASNLTRFAAPLGFEPPDYEGLHAWSIAHREEFWRSVWNYCGVVGERGDTALAEGERFPGSRWFPEARLNYAENLLRRNDDAIAIVSILEDGQRRCLTYAELREASMAFAATLAELGVGQGDRVAGWLPNVAETVIAMLAASSLGAIWSSCSPDFGVEGALDRFGQIRPKVLIACDGYQYGGRRFDVRQRARDVRDAVPSIEHLLWVSVGDTGKEPDAIAEACRRHLRPSTNFVRLPFASPLYILYSSGTTGKPKCIGHGTGGTLLQHCKEHRLHGDLRADDVLFFFTTCGWMMWNWLVSALATGCRIVLYDGSPFHPNPGALMDMAEREGVTVFGAGAKYFSAIEKARVAPRRSHDLRALRSILSTGSPLAQEGFRYVYRDIKQDVALASISGGTDLISCFALGCPWLPVHEGELQCAGLGMAVDVFDAAGKPVRGAKGELVCTRSFPSAPIWFWDDPNDAKYRAAYFDKYEGVWAHGDFAEITANAGLIVYGRSDATLNPGGVRIGTAELYRQVEAMDEVVDSVAIGQEWEGDTRIVLFVKLRPGATLDHALRGRIRRRIREHASPRHVPAVVAEVPDVPRTLSGKISELAVREVVHGRRVENTTALANPEALQPFRDWATQT